MKVAIGSKIMSGPWGGGNNFVKNLSKYLEEKDFGWKQNTNNKL